MTISASPNRFLTSTGIEIYQIPVEAFPGFGAYCYLIPGINEPTLIDTGSGLGSSNTDLLSGLKQLPELFGITFQVSDIRRIIITHGHIDHFGGLGFIQELTGAKVGIHRLDRRVLESYEERVIVATKDLRVYLERAGVDPQLRNGLMEMYGFAKRSFRSVPVDFPLYDHLNIDGMIFYHAPGHCPGQVCISIDNVLLSADHILSKTTPHQSPESITHYTGLGHYFDALRYISHVPGVELALGGHEEPIHDVYTRISDIRASHDRKLNRVMDAIKAAGRPCSISEVVQAVYPDKRGYDSLLALEEAGAHVEYLYEHGHLEVSNLKQVEQEENPALYFDLA
ncbi:MAG: MBL fold metallo-hydrolase [Anaerolineae bacterium]|nr:MBL fold metallo-hydrolase [Anaerolineae bacterium]